MEAAIDLLSMLRQSNASFALYNKIVSWMECYYIQKKDVGKPPSREAVNNFLEHRYRYECLRPHKFKCRLPTNNLIFDVIGHRFLYSLYSLFTDELLMQPHNLIFERTNPSIVQHVEPSILGEIHTGSAYKFYEQQHPNTQIIPLIIFGDGTVIDGSMKKSMEPFSFTLGIFRQHVRMLPTAWRILGYIKNNPSTLFTKEQIMEGNIYRAEYNIHEDDPEYVPDHRLEFHAQLHCALGEILDFQKLTTGMNFKLPWMPKNDKYYPMKTPVAFFMGDTPEHDKLCCLRKPNYACRMCDMDSDDFDNSKKNYELCDTQVLKQFMEDEDYEAVKDLGYYPCKENILLEVEFLDPRGMSMALPPENMHVVLLGIFPQLIHGLSRVRKVIQKSKQTREAEEKGVHYVFNSKDFKDESRAELRRIGGLLMWQPDPNKVKTLFPESGYLIDIDKKDNASTGKKSAHEMRGVLLTIILFCFIRQCQ